MSRRANYMIARDMEGEPLVLRDLGPWDRHPTITNDAEAVVEHLASQGLLPEGRRLLYWDSDGRRDEILVKDGKFAGFQPGGKEEAV